MLENNLTMWNMNLNQSNEWQPKFALTHQLCNQRGKKWKEMSASHAKTWTCSGKFWSKYFYAICQWKSSSTVLWTNHLCHWSINHLCSKIHPKLQVCSSHILKLMTCIISIEQNISTPNFVQASKDMSVNQSFAKLLFSNTYMTFFNFLKRHKDPSTRFKLQAGHFINPNGCLQQIKF